MDIKEKIEELVEKIKKDDSILENFQKDPIATVEKLLGIDLPNDQIEKIVDGVKAKIGMDQLSDGLKSLKKLGGLFGK
ncbi:MAG: hypothetical protein E7655_06725 [Ruminococcaceae bacterium]|nr:hypothetical protein [Oscillospiraceae bacterium]